jgi:signal transduction histidine kinase
VATHRGDVEVESELGEGTTFRVRLPKRAEDVGGEG